MVEIIKMDIIMKKILFCLMALISVALVGCNPDEPEEENNTLPKVEATFPSVEATTVTGHFAMNEYCEGYTILIAEKGSLNGWLEMTGSSLSDLVKLWGIGCVADTTYTWTQLTPGTDQEVYVLVQGADTTYLDIYDVRTANAGGSGESVITVTVSDITSTSARVTFTPNDQTYLFKDMIITQEAFNDYGEAEVEEMLKADSYTYYETDSWNWETLDAGTAYYAIAIGQNAEGEWGSMTKEAFSTLESKGVVPHFLAVARPGRK